MSRVVLVHWHADEAAERADRLRAFGYTVDVHWQHAAGSALTRLMAAVPAAVVIDLGRLPAHGRSVATWLRGRKASRQVPLVFVPGDAAKTAAVAHAFPDAVFAPWPRLRAALAKAIAAPPRDPVVPRDAGYSGTPLPRKLGLGPGGRLAVVRAPRDFAATLGEVPDGARLTNRLAGGCDIALLFCRALAELRTDWPTAVAGLAERGTVWVAWPKRTSGVVSDLTEDVVRAFGLDLGFVDTKVCAIDAIWSALRFSRRRARK